jgi:hypothetical protein
MSEPIPDDETVERLMHVHDLAPLGCPHDPSHEVKHSHWGGLDEHGHDFAC